MAVETSLPVLDPMTDKLLDALSDLMEKKDLDAITTTEILQRSGVSRSTFYRKYRDKYELINQSYQNLFNSTMRKVQEGASFKSAFISLYTVLTEYPVFFRRALRSTDPNGLRAYIFRISYQLYIDMLEKYGMDMTEKKNRILLWGYIHGSLAVTCEWVERGMPESVDTLFRICYELLPYEFQTCIAVYYM